MVQIQYLKRLVTLMMSMLTIIITSAQETDEEALGAWYMFSENVHLSNRFSIPFDAQLRLYEVSGNRNHLLVLNGLNYHFSDKWTGSVGFGFLDSYYDDSGQDSQIQVTEKRIYETLTLNNKIRSINLSNRFRLDHRYLDQQGHALTQHRFRYRIRVTIPLSKHWFLDAYNETFASISDQKFQQNWSFSALGYRVNENLKFEIGLLKHLTPTENNNRLQLGIIHKTDLRQKHKPHSLPTD